jgi:predicted nucleic acid-binding protein
MRALLDTSFFVAREPGRPLRDMSEVSVTEVSVVTIAELTVGVLLASDADRPVRLSAVESTWDPLPVDAEVARAFAQIVAHLRGRRRRVPMLDALVAATAIVAGVPVVTQDRDYDDIPGVTVIAV